MEPGFTNGTVPVVLFFSVVRPVIITNGTQMSSLLARLFSVRIDLIDDHSIEERETSNGVYSL